MQKPWKIPGIIAKKSLEKCIPFLFATLISIIATNAKHSF